MNNDIKISIIIPVFNTVKTYSTDKYLLNNIKSITNQTYNNLEIIYIDNNSEDESIDIIKSYAEKDPRIKIYQETTPGVSNARNKGIDVATGDYFTFVDSDDFIGFNLIQDAVEKLASNNFKTDILIGDFIGQSPNGFVGNSLRKVAINNWGKDIKEIYAWMECVPNIFFKKSFASNHNLKFNTKIKVGEDYLFNVSAIVKTQNIDFYSSYEYYYQLLDNSCCRKLSDDYLTFIDAFDEVLKLGVDKYGCLNPNNIAYYISQYNALRGRSINKKLFDEKYFGLLQKYKINKYTIPLMKLEYLLLQYFPYILVNKRVRTINARLR